MKLKLDEDYGPYIWITSESASYATEVEVPRKQVTRWRRIMAQYEIVQKEMGAILDSICQKKRAARDAEHDG